MAKAPTKSTSKPTKGKMPFPPAKGATKEKMPMSKKDMYSKKGMC